MDIIGMLGAKGHGKNVAADALTGEGWLQASFAAPLYEEVAQAFGVTVEFLQRRETKEAPLAELALEHCKVPSFVSTLFSFGDIGLAEDFLTRPRSPRFVLQYWGTDYRRQLFGDGYWREQLKARMKAQPDAKWVVTDVRYPDEAQMLKGLSDRCRFVRVIRPSLLGSQDEGSLHISERAMREYPVELELINEGKLEEFQERVRLALLGPVHAECA